jgi:hypothetical protein
MPFTIGNRDLTNVSGIRLVVRGQISLIHSSSHAPILFANKWLWYLWNICNQSFIKYFSYAVATIMLLSWDHHFESFTVPTMTWLIVAKYLCHRWLRICSTRRKHYSLSFPPSWLITAFVIRRLSLVEQELLTLLEHMSSPTVCSGVCVVRSLVFCVGLCRSLFVLLSFFSWPLCCFSFFSVRILITL